MVYPTACLSCRGAGATCSKAQAVAATAAAKAPEEPEAAEEWLCESTTPSMYRIKAEYVTRVAVLERERMRLEAEAHALHAQLAIRAEQGTSRSTDFEKARAWSIELQPVLARWLARPMTAFLLASLH
jgi:hypothetical protein